MDPHAIPKQCMQLNTPWPLTLSDAISVYESKQPSERYLKRMRIDCRTKSTMSKFITTKKSASGLTLEQRKEAQKRRDEYVANAAFCEGCNCRTIQCAREASICCPRCANSVNFNPVDTSYREGVSLHSQYLYKQSNHFRDHLKRVQGIESTEIPKHVVDRVKFELNKRTLDHSKVTCEEVRAILKQLGLSKLYNHNIRLWSIVTKNKPPQLDQLQETELCHLFSQLVPVWESVRPPNRSNMLSYR